MASELLLDLKNKNIENIRASQKLGFKYNLSELEERLKKIENEFDLICLDTSFLNSNNDYNLFCLIKKKKINEFNTDLIKILHYQYEKFNLIISHIENCEKYLMPLPILNEFKKGCKIFCSYLQRHKSFIGQKKKLKRKFESVFNRVWKLNKPLINLINLLEKRVEPYKNEKIEKLVWDKSKSKNDNYLVNFILKFYLAGNSVAIWSNDADITKLVGKFFEKLDFQEKEIKPIPIFYFNTFEELTRAIPYSFKIRESLYKK